MNEKRLASLHELQTIYSVEDLYDFLELIEVHSAIVDEHKAENK